ncbi:RHS repeat protein, partial [Candidatus Gracilibacteria bacterium]|nr:RHS repeat protein [Candidatus Gracilibacteria bacterium]
FQYQADRTIITTVGLDGRQDVETIRYNRANTMTGIEVNGQAVLGSAFDATLSPGELRDGNNNATATVFTTNGLPLTTTNALSQTMQRQYDGNNNLVALTDAQGVTTRYRYDALNNVISTTVGITTSSPLRATTLYTYSTNVRYSGDSLLQAVRSPDGVVTRYEYPTSGTLTQRGQVSRMIVGYGTALAQTTAYEYDALGRVTATVSGVGTALERRDTTVYNADNTVERTIQNYKDGTFDAARPDEDVITSYGYDLAGRQVWVRDALGRATATHYNARGRVDWRIRNVSPLSFDAQGQVVFQGFTPTQAAANVATRYGYDGLGRTTLVTETGILTGSFTLATRSFSAAAERVTLTEYDALSRPMTVTLNYRPGVTASADTNVRMYTRYDGAGNVITQTDALGRRSYTQYDALNRPITVTLNFEDGNPLSGPRDADTVQVTRYDDLGRVERVIENYVDGVFTATEPITDRVTHYAYDTLNRVVTTTVNLAPGESDPALNRVSVASYDPTTTRLRGQRDPLGRWTSFQYDALGRMNRQIANCRTSGNQPTVTGCAAYSTTPATAISARGRPLTRWGGLSMGRKTMSMGCIRPVAAMKTSRPAASTMAWVASRARWQITSMASILPAAPIKTAARARSTMRSGARGAHSTRGTTRRAAATTGSIRPWGGPIPGTGRRRWAMMARAHCAGRRCRMAASPCSCSTDSGASASRSSIIRTAAAAAMRRPATGSRARATMPPGARSARPTRRAARRACLRQPRPADHCDRELSQQRL